MDKQKKRMNLRQRLAFCALLLTCQYNDAVGRGAYDDRRRNNQQGRQLNQWQGQGQEQGWLAAPRDGRPAGQTTANTHTQWPAGRNIFTAYNHAVGNTDQPHVAHTQNNRIVPTPLYQTINNPWMRTNETAYHESYPYRAAAQNQNQHPSFASMQSTTNRWANANSNNRGGYQRAVSSNGLQNTADWQRLLHANPATGGTSPGNLTWSPSDAIDQGNWLDVTNLPGTQMPRLQNLTNFTWPGITNGNQNNGPNGPSATAAARGWTSPETDGRIYPAQQILQFNPDNATFLNGRNNANSGNWSQRGNGGGWPYQGATGGYARNWPNTTTARQAAIDNNNNNRNNNRHNNQWSNIQSGNIAPVSPTTSGPSTSQWMVPGNPVLNYPNHSPLERALSEQQIPGSSPGSSFYGNMYR